MLGRPDSGGALGLRFHYRMSVFAPWRSFRAGLNWAIAASCPTPARRSDGAATLFSRNRNPRLRSVASNALICSGSSNVSFGSNLALGARPKTGRPRRRLPSRLTDNPIGAPAGIAKTSTRDRPAPPGEMEKSTRPRDAAGPAEHDILDPCRGLCVQPCRHNFGQ